METTLIIDGVSVRFRKTGGTAIRYLERTGRELNTDLANFLDALSGIAKENDKVKQGITLMQIETKWMYDFLYVMAQQANPNIPSMVEWLDGFDEFDVQQIMINLMPMIKKETQVSPKNG